MKVLLDTHVFLWAADCPERLSAAAREMLEDDGTDALLSVASLWEIQLKAEKGMLLGGMSPAERLEFLRDQVAKLRIRLLPIRPAHVFALSEVPMLHKDPFDRLLVAQARAEGVPLMTGDRAVARYPVRTIW